MRPFKGPNDIIHHHSSLFYLFSRSRLRGWGTAGKPAESDANRTHRRTDDAVQIVTVANRVNLKPDSYSEQKMDLYGKVSVTISRLILEL